MRAGTSDSCGCFPTGHHYPGIAHLLKVLIRGLIEQFAADSKWADIPIAVLDVETTGRDASVDRVVEVGIAVGRGGEVVARYNWLVNPGVPIPEEVQKVHGITDADVKDAPRFEEIAHEIATALNDCVPAAYNAAFDKAFMVNEFARAKMASRVLTHDVEWVDPLIWAREIHSDEKSRALGDVAARLGIALENAHRASDDAEATLPVLYALAKDPRIPDAYGALIQEQRRHGHAQADARRMWNRP